MWSNSIIVIIFGVRFFRVTETHNYLCKAGTDFELKF